jgi:hypothetical protein
MMNKCFMIIGKIYLIFVNKNLFINNLIFIYLYNKSIFLWWDSNRNKLVETKSLKLILS